MIKETIDRYLPEDNTISEEIIRSTAYRNIIKRAATIEEFASNPNFPDVIKMICDSIRYHADRLGMPSIVPYALQKEKGYRSDVLLISQLGDIRLREMNKTKSYEMFGIRIKPWFNIEIEGNPTKYFSRGPIVKVNRKNPSGNQYSGMIFDGFNISYHAAQGIIKGFTPLQYTTRNEAMVKYAELVDRIEGTTSTRQCVVGSIADGKAPYMGIDERTLAAIDTKIDGKKVIGVAHQYNGGWHEYAIKVLIERPDNIGNRKA